jgi:hypothetical protein
LTSPWTNQSPPDWKARSWPADAAPVPLNALEPIQLNAWLPPAKLLASIPERSILSVPGVKSRIWSGVPAAESAVSRNVKVSAPPLPFITSAPRPARNESAPEPPVRTSLPLPPNIVNRPPSVSAEPSKTSLSPPRSVPASTSITCPGWTPALSMVRSKL